MKYGIPTRPPRVRPPRLRSRVPPRLPATPSSSADLFPPSPKELELMASTRFLTRRPSFHLPPHPPPGPRNPIQNP